MHPDWYQATIPHSHDAVVSILRRELGGLAVSMQPATAWKGYAKGIDFRDCEGSQMALVSFGGQNEFPNVKTSGNHARHISEVIREMWPIHSVSRVDVAEDFVAEGSFDLLNRLVLDVGRLGKVKGRQILPDDPADGRTRYLGSEKSITMARLYDKTAETRRSLPRSRRADVPDHWTRLELQVRPTKSLKVSVASMPWPDIWGISRWSKTLARIVFDLDVPRINPMEGWEPDPDRSLRFLSQNFRRALEHSCDRFGGWEALGARLGELNGELFKAPPR